MKRKTASFLVLMGFAGLSGCGQSPSSVAIKQAPTSADNKQAYITLLKGLSDGWTLHRNDPKPQMDLAQILAQAQNMILDFNAIETDDPDLLTIRDEAKAGVQQAAVALRTLDQMPKPPGAGDIFVASFAYGFVLRPDLAVELGDNAQKQANAVQDQVRSWIAGIQRAEAAKLLLQRAIPKYAGPNFNMPSVLSVDIDESIGGGGEPDWITLTNNSGRDLNNAVVSVTLFGVNGETKENIHFIPLWRSGQTIHSWYEPGIIAGDKVVGRQTVTRIQSATINLASDEGTQNNIIYQYAGSEKDKDLQAYLNAITLYAHYRPFSKGIFSNDERAVICSFAGMPILPRAYPDNPIW